MAVNVLKLMKSVTPRWLTDLDADAVFQAVLVLVVAVCYHNALDCNFVYDDEQAVVNNADVRAETGVWDLFSNDFWDRRPVNVVGSHISALNRFIHKQLKSHDKRLDPALKF